MNGNALGQPTILQPGQMPMQGQNFQYAGFPQPGQMTPGMVPGVPGSMGLNPGVGGPIQGQQNPGGPVATPGGGGAHPPAGTPGGPPLGVGMVPGVPGSMGLNPGMHGNAQDFMSQLQNWRGQFQDWRQQRPDHTQGMDPGAFHQSIMAWRQQRPDLFGQFAGHGSQISPQGAPNALTPPMMPPTPAPTGAMPVNPGMSASTNPNQYGLPTYGG